MAEYIEREAALSSQNKSMNLFECRKRLESIPAADVRPVVRGKWLDDCETGCSECSVCHDSFLWEDFKGVADWNYCPNCGADMRPEPPKEET